jgi:hypothetical protein
MTAQCPLYHNKEPHYMTYSAVQEIVPLETHAAAPVSRYARTGRDDRKQSTGYIRRSRIVIWCDTHDDPPRGIHGGFGN